MIAGPFIRVDGRAWALANPAKPAWMNPRFHYGLPVGGHSFVSNPFAKSVTCPRCGCEFQP